MNSKSLTLPQKKWQAWLREVGCCVFGMNTPAVIHHIKGACYNLNDVGYYSKKGIKKGLAGEWMVLGLSGWAHDSDNPCSRHKNKSMFEQKYGTEKDLWIKSVSAYERKFGVKPMSEKEYSVILSKGFTL